MLGDPTPDIKTSSRNGLIMVKNNDDIAREDAERSAAENYVEDAFITSLSSHVTRCWQANKSHKDQNIEKVLLQCLRQRSGKYDPDVAEKIKAQGEPDIYMMISDIKCRAAESWIKDIVLPSGEPPFHFDPTPIPELPEEFYAQAKSMVVEGTKNVLAENGLDARQLPPQELQKIQLSVAERVKKDLKQMADEQAKEDADQITNEVNDEFVEGGWYSAMSDFISDLVDYPAAFLHGPVVRKKKKVIWSKGQDGKSVPSIETVITKEYEAVSPFDMYPSANAKTEQDGNLIHRIRYSCGDLSKMLGVPGFNDDAIRAVLAMHGAGGLRNWTSTDSERDDLEDRDTGKGDPESIIECIKFMGSVQGKLLIDWGMTKDEIPDAELDYDVIVYQIGSFVISARLNPHPLGRRRYYSTSFVKKRNTIWGKGVSQLMRDIQRICNSSSRALIRNMGIASGPQVWSIIDRLPEGHAVSNMYPWKHWKFTSKQAGGAGDLPMGFFQPPLIAEQLIKVYQYYYDQASEITGIPAYIYGSENVGGAGKTARGLTMLMNAAARSLKAVVKNIDMDIITKSAEEHWFHIIYTDPSKCIGDIRVIARASDYMLQQEARQIQLDETLQKTNNPVDLQIMGVEGRAEMLRELLKTFSLPTEKIIPDRDSLINRTADQKIQEMIMNLSKALGIDPQQLMQAAQGQAAGNQNQGGQQTNG